MSYDIKFQALVIPTLMRCFEDLFSDIYDSRVYSTVAPDKRIFPYLVYYSTDGGGDNADKMNQSGWEGEIAFRSVDTSLLNAWSLLADVSELFDSASAPGYSISIRPLHPQWYPVERTSTGAVYSAGLIARVSVYKN